MVALLVCGKPARFLGFGTNETNGTKKMLFFKNEAENLLITQDRAQKTNPNEPKNEAGKLLKINHGEKTNRKRTRDLVETSPLFRLANCF